VIFGGGQIDEQFNGLNEYAAIARVALQDGLQLNTKHRRFAVNTFNVSDIQKLTNLCGGEVTGVEAVLAGIPVARLSAAMTSYATIFIFHLLFSFLSF
jgi:pyridoxine 5'-phosphate synthase PdxJ